MPCRRLAIAVASATLAVALTACTPEPAATPTPTDFASEEEAFAAAEETYRAYVDALNARNAGDENADPAAYLTGEMLESDSETRSELINSGRSISGDMFVVKFIGNSFDKISGAAAISATVCMDASDAVVLDEHGTDVTPTDAPDLYALEIDFHTAAGILKIESSESVDAPC